MIASVPVSMAEEVRRAWGAGATPLVAVARCENPAARGLMAETQRQRCANVRCMKPILSTETQVRQTASALAAWATLPYIGKGRALTPPGRLPSDVVEMIVAFAAPSSRSVQVVAPDPRRGSAIWRLNPWSHSPLSALICVEMEYELERELVLGSALSRKMRFLFDRGDALKTITRALVQRSYGVR